MPTVRQAGQRLGVSPSLVYRLCKEQVIPHRRCQVGRHVRIEIDAADIDHYRRLCRLDAAQLTPAHIFPDPAGG